MKSKIIAIIPARYASTRFPGKPLVDIGGTSMIQRVVNQVKKVARIDQIIVATDDLRIYEHLMHCADIELVMTDADLPSGSDRCAAVMNRFFDKNEDVIIINIQGDEPFIAPEQIEDLIQLMLENPNFQIGTLVKKIENPAQIFNPNIVKVTFSIQGKALYFSRSAIPYLRGINETEWINHADFYRHIGMYAYQNIALHNIAALQPSALERNESLEQLRWLENGLSIGVKATSIETIGIDTPEDLAAALIYLEKN